LEIALQDLMERFGEFVEAGCHTNTPKPASDIESPHIGNESEHLRTAMRGATIGAAAHWAVKLGIRISPIELVCFADRASHAAYARAKDECGGGPLTNKRVLDQRLKLELLQKLLSEGITDHNELAARMKVSRATFYRNWRSYLP
jgi:hypothetical protein